MLSCDSYDTRIDKKSLASPTILFTKIFAHLHKIFSLLEKDVSLSLAGTSLSQASPIACQIE